MTNNLKRAIDTDLGGLRTTELERAMIFNNALEGKKMKKKLSVAFVLIMVLILLAAGALAALLSSKEFVNQIMAPLAAKDPSDKWTNEQTNEIIRLAEENGLVITDELRRHFENADETYKEELMRIFAKMELGAYPATWSIEDQAWYDALLVKCGLSDIQTRVVPANDEISMEQAISIAISHIKGVFHDSTDVTNKNLYQRFVEYRQFVEQNNIVSPRMWYIAYKSLDAALSSFHFVITSDGTIKESSYELGIRSMQGTPTVDSVLDYYSQTYGLHYEWTQKVWVELQRDMERAVAVHGHKGRFSLTILRQEYGTPDARAISADKAIEVAQDAIAQESGLQKADLEAGYKARTLYLVGKEGPVWKVAFVNTEPNGPYAYTLYHAEVDAYNGTVKNVGKYQPGKNLWFEAYMLVDTIYDDSDIPSHC